MAIDERLIAIGYGGAVGGDDKYINEGGRTNAQGHFTKGGLFRHSQIGSFDRSIVWNFDNDPMEEQRAIFGIINFNYGTGRQLQLIGGARVEDSNIIYTPSSTWNEKYYNYITEEETDDLLTLDPNVASWTVDNIIGQWYCSIPIFENTDIEGIRNYIEQGDYSSALNYDAVIPSNNLFVNWEILGECKFNIFAPLKDVVIGYTTPGHLIEDIVNLSCTWKPSEGLEMLIPNGASITIKTIASDTEQGAINSLTLGDCYTEEIEINGFYNINLERIFSGNNITYNQVNIQKYKFIGMSAAWNYTTDEGEELHTNTVMYVWKPKAISIVDIYDPDGNTEYNFTYDDESTLLVKRGFPNDDDSYQEPDFPDDDIPDDSDEGYNTIGLLTTTYIMNESQAQNFGAEIWTNDAMKNIKLLNSSPIENVLSIKYFPMSLGPTGTDNIVLGNVTLNARGKKLDDSFNQRVGSWSIHVDEFYKNFIDYSMTNISIHLPFSGDFQLPTAEIMGKNLKVDLIMDVINGLGRYILYTTTKSGAYVQFASYDCSIGIDIPLTASNRAQMQQGYITGLSKTLIDVATENYVGAIGEALGMATIQNHSNTSGSSSPALACYETKEIYLIVDSPKTNTEIMNAFKHSHGLKCNLGLTLGACHGFTQCDNVDVSGISGASEQEKAEIKAMLEGGFYA